MGVDPRSSGYKSKTPPIISTNPSWLPLPVFWVVYFVFSPFSERYYYPSSLGYVAGFVSMNSDKLPALTWFLSLTVGIDLWIGEAWQKVQSVVSGQDFLSLPKPNCPWWCSSLIGPMPFIYSRNQDLMGRCNISVRGYPLFRVFHWMKAFHRIVNVTHLDLWLFIAKLHGVFWN